MTGHAQREGEVAGAVIHVQQAQFLGDDVAGIGTGDDQLFIRVAPEPALRGVAHLKEQSIGVREVTQLPVREAVEGHRRGLQAHADVFHLQIQHALGGDGHGPLVGNAGVVHRVFRAGLMQVDLHVDLLGVDHVGHCIGHLLGQGAVLLAGIATVQVPGLGTGQTLARGLVGVDVRIRPLIDGIGGPGTEMEGPLVPVSGGEVHELGLALQRIVVGEAGHVDLRDHVDRALLHGELLQHDHGRHVTRRLVGMGAAQDQDAAAGLLALQHVDVHVTDGALQVLVVGGELVGPGDGAALGHDVFLKDTLLVEAVASDGRAGDGNGQDDAGADNAFFLHGSTSLFDHEDPKDQADQDHRAADLIHDLGFLEEHVVEDAGKDHHGNGKINDRCECHSCFLLRTDPR